MNKITNVLVEAFIRRPSSSLLLIGTRDDGLDDICTDICQKLLGKSNRFNVIEIDMIDDSGISVEQVRELKQQLSTKVSSDNAISRIAIIKHADTATREAQNALLKLLEEPANQTIVLLQAHNKQKLLPTIQSRCQTISILPITRAEAIENGKRFGMTDVESTRLYMLTGGKQKLFYDSLANPNEDNFNHITDAKKFLSSTVFNRLATLKQYDKAETVKSLITSLELVSVSALHASNPQNAKRWVDIIKQLRICEQLLASNAQAKLVFMRLSIHL